MCISFEICTCSLVAYPILEHFNFCTGFLCSIRQTLSFQTGPWLPFKDFCSCGPCVVFVLNCKFKPSVTKLTPRVLTGESFVVENFPSFWPPWALSHFRYFYMFTIILAFIALNASLGCFFLKGKVCIILTSFVLHLTQINLDFSCILIHEGLKKTLFLV